MQTKFENIVESSRVTFPLAGPALAPKMDFRLSNGELDERKALKFLSQQLASVLPWLEEILKLDQPGSALQSKLFKILGALVPIEVNDVAQAQVALKAVDAWTGFSEDRSKDLDRRALRETLDSLRSEFLAKAEFLPEQYYLETRIVRLVGKLARRTLDLLPLQNLEESLCAVGRTSLISELGYFATLSSYENVSQAQLCDAKRSALEILKRIGLDETAEDIKSLLLDCLSQFGVEAHPVLQVLMNDEMAGKNFLLNGIRIIYSNGPQVPGAVETLMRLTDHPECQVRSDALWFALKMVCQNGEIRDERVLPKVREIITDSARFAESKRMLAGFSFPTVRFNKTLRPDYV